MGKSKIAGPGRMGSMKNLKKSLKGGAQANVRTIPSNDSLTVRFLENPEEWHGYYEHWLKDGPRPCVTDDCDGCNSDDEDERRKNFRYLANAFIVDDQKVRALKMPKTLVEQLVNFHKKYKGTLLDRDYELSKSGSGQNGTKYMAAPDAPAPMKLSRFEDQKFDLSKVLQGLLGDGEDDDDDEDYDDEPVKSKKSKPKKSQKNPWDDEPVRKKSPARSVKKSASSVKRPVKRTATVKRRVRR